MKLIEMSISAGVLIMLLVLLRTVGSSWLPKRVFVLLWIMAMIRLLLPVSLPMKNGIATPVWQMLHKISNMLDLDLLFDESAAVSDAVNEISSAEAACGSAGQLWNMLAGDISTAAYGIWIMGAAGCGIYFFYSFWKESQMLAQALPLQERLETAGIGGRPDAQCLKQLLAAYESAQKLAGQEPDKKDAVYRKIYMHDRVVSPYVWGMVRQRIVYPRSLCRIEQSKMQYMLTHELIHMKRHDNLWKLIAAAVVCLHWFNPLVWVMYVLLARDLELSCDEHVLALYGSASREDYAMTLLTLIQNQNGRTLFCSGFGKNPAKERIVAIMKYRKITKAGMLSAVLLLAGAATVFAADDQAAASDATQIQESTADNQASDAEAEGVEAKAGESKDVPEDAGEGFVTYTVTDTSKDRKSMKQSECSIKVDKNSEPITLEFAGVMDDLDSSMVYVAEDGTTYKCVERDSSDQPSVGDVKISGTKYYVLEPIDTVED